MKYITTSEVLAAVKLRVVRDLDALVDDVIVFDGSLARAIEDHFGQTTRVGLKRVVFIGLSDDVPNAISGAGLPNRLAYIVDIYAIVRSDGRARYTTDLDRLYRISDRLVFETFDVGHEDTEFRAVIASNTFRYRRRSTQDIGGLMANVVRYEFTAMPVRT